jgi:hypothetical protein
LQHPAGYAIYKPQATDVVSPLNGKWIGLKHALYTKPAAMKLEQRYQQVVSRIWTNWKKVFDYTDKRVGKDVIPSVVVPSLMEQATS